MLQKVSDVEPKVGIFFVRYPGQSEGTVISMALKYNLMSSVTAKEVWVN